ncbi:universal stress protein [Deltaproteobacteria bacterium PRO3]|nr:universal stress protein [Deltaproteobacteria bacterium PRO3]
MYKNILVCLDGGSADNSVINAALYLAQKLKAKLHGLTVQDILTLEGPLMYDISGAMAFIPQLNLLEETRKVMEERSKNILTGFVKACEDAGVAHHESISEGIVHKVILEKTQLHDLTILGRRGLNYELDKELLGSTTDRVVSKAKTPVLVVTHNFEAFKNPLLAYDGSPQSREALATAAKLCSDLQLPLTVLHVGKDKKESEAVLREAKEYLDAYTIVAKYEHAEGNPHQEVPQYVKLHNHDVLMMGARGHGRLMEFILGSTTEYALWSGNCHVLVDQ